MPQPLQLKQRHLALRRREAPSIELAVDGGAEPAQDVLGLPTPAPGLGARLGQLLAEPLGLAPRRRQLPPVKRDARERGNENQELERLQRQRDAPAILDREIGRHEQRDYREERDRHATIEQLKDPNPTRAHSLRRAVRGSSRLARSAGT